MRDWRKTQQPNAEQLKRMAARSIASQYARKGILVRTDCVSCGSSVDLELHHPDYDRPLQVISLCRTCHVSCHKGELTVEGLPFVEVNWWGKRIPTKRVQR
jgi:hypothetical protein